ncbi:hypothetical protein ADL03_27175 [Nocardia sp. NRRL S-836]|nr:hypothetical protein ADL03_27175 [Nocardia sp. NRRL S-836]
MSFSMSRGLLLPQPTSATTDSPTYAFAVTSLRDRAISVIQEYITGQVGDDADPDVVRGQAVELADRLIDARVLPAVVVDATDSAD